jgi:DNA topoisomerase IA
LLPPLRDGETAQLQDPKVEEKETQPPPRYNEGTLIEAMQNAWRFVDDEFLRERLKEAKGIGTPATRAEIIGGLKKQGFLMPQGKHIVPISICSAFLKEHAPKKSEGETTGSGLYGEPPGSGTHGRIPLLGVGASSAKTRYCRAIHRFTTSFTVGSC